MTIFIPLIKSYPVFYYLILSAALRSLSSCFMRRSAAIVIKNEQISKRGPAVHNISKFGIPT